MPRARVDAVSDHTEQLPPSVAAAEAALRALARRQRPRARDPVTIAEVTPADPEWAAFERYAAWSIDVELLAEDERGVVSLHDSGLSVTAALTAAEAFHLRRPSQRTDVRRDLLRRAVDVLSRERLLLHDLRQAYLLRGDLEALDPGAGDGL